MQFSVNEFLVPLYQGHAASPGWTTATDNMPMGVTWHWTALRSLSACRNILGGEATLNSRVSSHYCVGQSYVEGVDRYVGLEDRSWHAGVGQVIRWDGQRSNNDTKGSRACIGIETCNIGYARPGHPASADWIEEVNTDCKWIMQIEPWGEEQFDMMVHIGREIIERWPHIGWRDHHGHHDICPGYKQDVAGFPFARMLRAIYEDESIPDIWSPFNMPKPRQRALVALGYDLGSFLDDGDFGHYSHRALAEFQVSHRQVVVPHWTKFTSDAVYHELLARGLDPVEVAQTPLT